MKRGKSLEKLAKFLDFVLGRNPAEFGLVPDEDGYVKLKELLKAVCEEDGWKHVRRASLDEVLLSLPVAPIEISGALIRARDRGHLAAPRDSENPPGQMYTCVRKKAYPVVLDKGVPPAAHPYVILSTDPLMAERIGRRYDPAPVRLVVSVRKMLARGQRVLAAGGDLFLVDQVPPDCFTGPALPKPVEESRQKTLEKPAPSPRTPGSFMLEVGDEKPLPKTKRSRKKKNDWKRERKRMNRRGQGKGRWE